MFSVQLASAGLLYVPLHSQLKHIAGVVCRNITMDPVVDLSRAKST